MSQLSKSFKRSSELHLARSDSYSLDNPSSDVYHLRLQRYEDFCNRAIPKNGGFGEYLEMRNENGGEGDMKKGSSC